MLPPVLMDRHFFCTRIVKFQFGGAMAQVSNNAVILSVAKRSRRIFVL